MIGSIGFPEVVMIFVVVLLLFGPKKLPDFAKTFGKAVREFRKTVNEAKSTIEEEIEKADVTGDIKDIEQDIKQLGRMEIEDDHESEQPKTK
jgi:Tat protein translocase TatB subunit